MIRRARKLWRRRRTIRGEHFDVTVRRWWSPEKRRAARLSLRVLDASAERYAELARAAMRDAVLHGESDVLAGRFRADEWPYPDSPPDPL